MNGRWMLPFNENVSIPIEMLLRTECRVEMMLVSLLSNDIFKSTCYLLYL